MILHERMKICENNLYFLFCGDFQKAVVPSDKKRFQMFKFLPIIFLVCTMLFWNLHDFVDCLTWLLQTIFSSNTLIDWYFFSFDWCFILYRLILLVSIDTFNTEVVSAKYWSILWYQGGIRQVSILLSSVGFRKIGYLIPILRKSGKIFLKSKIPLFPIFSYFAYFSWFFWIF